MNGRYCVTIADVYGVPFAALSAPQGYEFTGEFRPALSGDIIMSTIQQLVVHVNDYNKSKYPRLILRAIPTAPTVESVYAGQTLEQLKEKAKTAKCWDDENLKFEWTGEFRKVQNGEHYLCKPDGQAIMLNTFGPTTTPRLIMRKCPTIKEIYGKELSELEIPEGYESTGEVRVPKAGETALMANGSGAYTFQNDVSGDYRRLILRKLPTVKGIYGAPLDKLTPPIGYRFTGEFRRAKAGETVMLTNKLGALEYICDEHGEHPRLILEKLPPTPTIKDVYGTDTPAIPKGWRFKEFRQVDRTEKIYILGNRCHSALEVSELGFAHYNWRIVLEKDLSTLTYTKTYTVEDVYGCIPKIPSGYKVIDFRCPKTGDVFLDICGMVITSSNNDWYYPHLILSPLGPR